MFNATRGAPPIAKTSLSEFAAAIAPHAEGSSTTGVMKSTVRIPARFSSIFHNAASSPEAQDVKMRSSEGISIFFRILERSAGPIFAAQPLVVAISVKRIKTSPSYGFIIIITYEVYSPAGVA
jgi:hypothetical protein